MNLVQSVTGTECNWYGVACNENQEHVVGLGLGFGNEKVGRLSNSISGLSHLKVLDISRNNLKNLPVGLCSIDSLTELSASFNDLNSIPDECQHWQQLSILNLINNKFLTLPAVIGTMTSLTKLYLSYNKLEILPNELFDLGTLQVLYLDHNQLTKLPVAISQLISLNSLILSGNLLSSLPVEITQLSKLQGKFADTNGSVGHVLQVSDNCLSAYYGHGEDLSLNDQKVVEWLTVDDQFIVINSPSNDVQKDICANTKWVYSGFITQNQAQGEWVDFISDNLAAEQLTLKGFQDFILYEYSANNENRKMFGSITQTNFQSWRIPTLDLEVGQHFIILAKPDPSEPTGIVAWRMRLVKLPSEDEIEPGYDFTPLLTFQPRSYSSVLGGSVSLAYPVFNGDPTPLDQLLEIPGLNDVSHRSEILEFSHAGKKVFIRPFKIEQSTPSSPGYSVNDDNLYKLNTNNKRLISAAPALASGVNFIALLELNNLFLDETSLQGRMKISTAINDEYFYSAQVEAYATQALTKTKPGLYLEALPGVANVVSAYYVYYDEQRNLMQQAVPPRPYNWDLFKEILTRKGFTNISMSTNGILAAVFNQQQYTAIADYKVSKSIYDKQHPEIYISGIDIVEQADLNNDGVKDVLFTFQMGAEFYSQKIYLIPLIK